MPTCEVGIFIFLFYRQGPINLNTTHMVHKWWGWDLSSGDMLSESLPLATVLYSFRQ